MVIASVRRRHKKSNTTDLELIDDCQMASISGAVIALIICYACIDIVIQHPQVGSLCLLTFGIVLILLLRRLGQCVGTKRILFQMKRFNLE